MKKVLGGVVVSLSLLAGSASGQCLAQAPFGNVPAISDLIVPYATNGLFTPGAIMNGVCVNVKCRMSFTFTVNIATPPPGIPMPLEICLDLPAGPVCFPAGFFPTPPLANQAIFGATTIRVPCGQTENWSLTLSPPFGPKVPIVLVSLTCGGC